MSRRVPSATATSGLPAASARPWGCATGTLTVTDWQAAITELGLTDLIRDAILTSARAYRKTFRELPEGIVATYDRSL
jgi:hypothetical protein